MDRLDGIILCPKEGYVAIVHSDRSFKWVFAGGPLEGNFGSTNDMLKVGPQELIRWLD